MDKEQATKQLKQTLDMGDGTVYSVTRHRTDHGRWFDLFVVEGESIIRITSKVAIALDLTYDRKRECIKMKGSGTNLAHDTVLDLSCHLYKNSFKLYQQSL